jgi:hypothetical protein
MIDGFTRFRRHLVRALAVAVLLIPFASRGETPGGGGHTRTERSPGKAVAGMKGTVRIAYLHHSTGGNVWNGGVPAFFRAWNAEHGTDYRITEITYPATDGGHSRLVRRLVRRYPWANYPYDYWNLWVAHTGSSRDRGELNLDDLAKDYDVIVFKHCFPVSGIGPDGAAPSVSSEAKTLANYRLQYQALKARLHQFPAKRFIVWTGPALTEGATNPGEARRAREWVEWVKGVWDEPGDNIFLWDFYALETEGGLYFKTAHATSGTDPHPNPAFSRAVAPLIGRRIADVVEGRGDVADLAAR